MVWDIGKSKDQGAQQLLSEYKLLEWTGGSPQAYQREEQLTMTSPNATTTTNQPTGVL